MTHPFKPLRRTLLAGLAATLLSAGAAAAELYKVTSIAPGLSPFIVNTAIAKLVNARVPGVEFQLKATGAATRHMVDAGQGKVDFLFGSPTINWLMVNRFGPFKEMAEAPDLEKNVGMIFAYQIGPYHYITRADSGIESLADLRGKRVFVGPPGGAARNVVLNTVLKPLAGLTAEDFEIQNFGFDAAVQAFQDDKIDVIVLPTNIPSPVVQQFALTKEIRFLDVDVSQMKLNRATGATQNEIPAGTYGANHQGPGVRTHGAIVNFSAGMHVDEEVVYQVTRAIWENLGEIHATAPWLESTIRPETALEIIPSRLHPGAERYYREQGWDIPAPQLYGPGN
jgi:hypothetical protein